MKVLLRMFLVTMLFVTTQINAQGDKDPNVFLITLDGVRWQDVFTGMDTDLLNSEFTQNKELLTEKFVGQSEEENRKMLMPFFLEYHC